MRERPQPAATLARAPALASRRSRLIAPLLAPGLFLLMATTADAQSATGTLCCDTANGQCVFAGYPEAGAPRAGTVPTPCRESVSSSGLMIAVPNVSASVCGATTCSAQVITYKTEPPTGFVGVCLAPYTSYRPTTPTTCYAVKIPGETNHPYAVVSASAKQVYAPYSIDAGAGSDYPIAHSDSYQVLFACYPHNVCGQCPCPSVRVSNSCCELPSTHMTSLDGQVARGYCTMAQRAAKQNKSCNPSEQCDGAGP